jgi:hypothetical protein
VRCGHYGGCSIPFARVVGVKKQRKSYAHGYPVVIKVGCRITTTLRYQSLALSHISYLPNSNLLTQVSGPIHTVTNTYEPNRDVRDVLEVKQNKVGTSVISSYDYSVNAIGQRTGVTTSGTALPAVPSWMWTYDALGQVTKAYSTITTSYQYDAQSCRIAKAGSSRRIGKAAVTTTVTSPTSAVIIYPYDADELGGNPVPYLSGDGERTGPGDLGGDRDYAKTGGGFGDKRVPHYRPVGATTQDGKHTQTFNPLIPRDKPRTFSFPPEGK